MAGAWAAVIAADEGFADGAPCGERAPKETSSAVWYHFSSEFRYETIFVEGQGMKVGHVVHCSGYSLAEKEGAFDVVDRRGNSIQGKFGDWTHVCVGNPGAGVLGRIPMSLRVAKVFDADCIVWSTGATFQNGVSEAEVMMECALAHSQQQEISAVLLRRISLIENESVNTLTSMEFVARILAERFAGRSLVLHLVTSANHAPRVSRDALVAFSATPRVILSIVPAHTCYGHKRPLDVLVRDLGD
jgi:hypothetical protein